MKFRDTLNLSFPRTATCLNVFAIIVFMWFDHLQSLFYFNPQILLNTSVLSKYKHDNYVQPNYAMNVDF